MQYDMYIEDGYITRSIENRADEGMTAAELGEEEDADDILG